MVLSRVKEIRDDDQVVSYATRAKENGGLGLAELAASDLVALINKYLPSKSKLTKTVLDDEESEAPQTATKMAPAKVYFPQTETKKPEVVGKPIMQDVTPPPPVEKRSMGPVEEFKFITVVDFRRLATKPEECTRILNEKLIALKEE